MKSIKFDPLFYSENDREQIIQIKADNKFTDYFVSSKGYIISYKTGVMKKLIPWYNKGYQYVSICINGNVKHCPVHRIVAETFIPNIDNKPEVNHKDGCKDNNSVENLEWVTSSENKIHAYKHKLKIPNPNYGSDCNLSVYTDEQIENVCLLLESNTIPIKEISKRTGVNKDTISRILTKDQWVKISDNYNISNYDKNKFIDTLSNSLKSSKYSLNQIEHVCDLLFNQNKSVKDISNITGVGIKTIQHIKYGESWTWISSKYK